VSVSNGPAQAPGRYFDDFVEGEVHLSAYHTISREDVLAYGRLTGDLNSMHLSPAAVDHHGRMGQIAHGMLGAGLAAGLLHPLGLFEGTVVALLGLSDWTFRRPLLVGEPVRSRMVVQQLRPSRSNPSVGIMVRRLSLEKRDNEELLGGSVTMMLRRRTGAGS
jgi:acyl dehydratase